MNKLLIGAFFCLSLSAIAADRPNQAEQNAIDTLHGLAGTTISIEKFFDGPGGLIGLSLLDAQNNRTIAWATPDGTHIIVGTVFDRNGINQTAVYSQKIAATPPPVQRLRNADGSYAVDANVFAALKTLPSIDEGDGPVEIWIVSDPLCPHCKRAHALSQVPENAHKFRIHWVLTSAVGGGQSAQVISDVLDHKITLDQAMSIERDPSKASMPVTMSSVTGAAIEHVNLLLQDMFPTPPGPAVPAVIAFRDGHYTVNTGFNPDQILASSAPPGIARLP